MIKELSNDEAYELVKNGVYGRLGCHANGETYVVPISYAYKDNALYFHTQEGKKVNMMRINPSVCFHVDELQDIFDWRSVIIQGQFKELEGEERTSGLKILLDREVPVLPPSTMKLAKDWPFTTGGYDAIKGVVFKIEINELSGRYDQTEPDEYSEPVV